MNWLQFQVKIVNIMFDAVPCKYGLMRLPDHGEDPDRSNGLECPVWPIAQGLTWWWDSVILLFIY